jgi:hypothetical protein
MDYQMLNTALGLQSLLASSLLLEFFYNQKRKAKVLTPRFITSLAIFLAFFAVLFLQRFYFVY